MQPLWKTVWRHCKKLKRELLYGPVILLLGTYSKKTKTQNQKDIYIHLHVHCSIITYIYTHTHIYIDACVLSHSVMSNSLGPLDCSPPGSSGHGILQARILEWVATSASRGSSHPRDRTCVSCITGRFSPDSSRKDPSRHLRVQSPCERAAAVSGRDPAASPRAPVSCSAI